VPDKYLKSAMEWQQHSPTGIMIQPSIANDGPSEELAWAVTQTSFF